MKIEQVIKIPQCKCIIFYDKNKKQKENTNETNLNVKQKQQKKKMLKPNDCIMLELNKSSRN